MNLLKKWLTQSIDIRPNEVRPMKLLLLFSFFLGASLLTFYIISLNLFLEEYSSADLPYIYIGQGVLGYLIWLVVSYIDRKLCAFTQLTTKLLIIVISFTIISVLNYFFYSAALIFFTVVWFRVLTFLSVVCLYGVVSVIFDIRQSRRLFGMVIIGEVVADIVVSILIPYATGIMSQQHILLLGVLFLIVVISLYFIILNPYRETLSKQFNKENLEESTTLNGSIFKNKYLRNIFITSLTPVVILVFTDYVFIDIVDNQFSDIETRASFLSRIIGSIAFIELIFKAFISRRLMSAGMKYSLITYTLSSLVIIFLATFFLISFGEGALFISFIIFAKVVDRVVRSSIFEPIFLVIYQTIDINRRLSFQNKIEGIAKPIGYIVTGIFLFAAVGIDMTYFLIGFIAVIILLYFQSSKMAKEYTLNIHNLVNAQATNQGKYAFYNFFENVNSYKFLARYEPYLLAKNIKINRDDSIADKHLKLNIIEKEGLVSQMKGITNFLETEKDKQVLSKTNEVINKFNCFLNLSLASLDVIPLHYKKQEHLMLARIYGEVTIYRTNTGAFSQLLSSTDFEIRRKALLSIGNIKSKLFWSHLFDNLFGENYFTSIKAFENIGERALPYLISLFIRSDVDVYVHLRLVKIIAKMNTEESNKELKSLYNFPSPLVQRAVLVSLSNNDIVFSQVKDSELWKFVEKRIEYQISKIIWLDNIKESCKSYNENDLSAVISNEIESKIRYIFTLLSILYSRKVVKKIEELLVKGKQEKAFGIEMIDHLFSNAIKRDIILLLDDSRVNWALLRKKFYHPPVDSLHTILEQLLLEPYYELSSWCKYCVLNVVSTTADYNSFNALVSMSEDINEILRRYAYQLLTLKNYPLADHFILKNRTVNPEDIKIIIEEIAKIEQLSSINSIAIFDFVSGGILLEKKKKETFYLSEGKVLLVIDGELKLEGEKINFIKGSVVCSFEQEAIVKDHLQLLANQQSLMLEISESKFLEFLEEHPFFLNRFLM